MTTAETAKVVVDGDEIVNLLLASLLTEDALVKIEAFDGEVNEDVQLVTAPPCIAESLQVNDENIRRLPEIELLAGPPVFLAARTIPHVLLGQHLRLLKLVQTLLEGDALLLTRHAGLPLLFQDRISELFRFRKGLLASSIVITVRVFAKDHVPGLLGPIDDDTLAETNKGAAGNVVFGRWLGCNVDNIVRLLLAVSHFFVATLVALPAVHLIALGLAASASDLVVALSSVGLGLVR